jgi:1-acyl-sn-glycerol-3-phosphate acyltransferase
VANHISYLDTLVIFPAIKGYFRPLGKKEIVKIPIVGFIYKQIVILVDRGSAQSRAKSMKLMWRVLKNEGNIVIFPEGTFNETGTALKDFYDGAFRLALTTGTDILPLLLPDTSERWHYSGWWKLWPGRNRVKFLEPVSVAGMTMADLAALKQETYRKMEAGLVAYAAERQGQEGG